MQIEVEELARVRLSPEDTLVVRLAHNVPQEAILRIMEHIQRSTGHDRVLVVPPGVRLEVVSKQQGVNGNAHR